MSRLFRKRANSRTDGPDIEPTPSTPRNEPVMTESILKKRTTVKEVITNADNTRRVSDRAPSLNVDIRNSLILPGLSQRFSVLLPTLSSVPESSIRSLLASQRDREGPSLTVEEEELLFAELRNDTRHDAHWKAASTSTLTSSASSPSMFSETDSNGPPSAPLDTPSPWPSSPPPTSASFSSFRTFGASDPAGPDPSVKVKSYGFSGNSSFRDEVYIRKAKRSAEGAGKRPDLGAAGDPPSTSPFVPSTEPSPAPLAAKPSQTQPYSAPGTVTKRQSMLAGLTPAQVKRISLALGEIEGRLSRPLVSADPLTDEDEEETLQNAQHTTPTRTHARLPSDSRSEVASEASCAFPYKASPIGSQFSGGPSPTRLPPSPRTHNLAAQVSLPQPVPLASPATNPRPVMIPSRTQPIRHQPSSSITTSIGSPVPLYIPGQPRPVGSAHRSEGSISSPADGSFSPRAATPTQTTSTSSHGHHSLLTGRESSSPPFPPRSTSLGRSQSVTQSAGRAKPSAGPAHLRAQSVDTAIVLGPSSNPHPSSTIEEEAEEDGSLDSYLPHVQVVPGRFNMADKRPSPGPSAPMGLGIRATGLTSRAVSQQGTIGSVAPSRDVVSPALRSPTLRRAQSSQSISSTFTPTAGEVAWDGLFDSDESPVAAEDEVSARDVLRKLSGLDAEELSVMQEKLVIKAKLERLALRGTSEVTPEIAPSPQLRSVSQPSPQVRSLSQPPRPVKPPQAATVPPAQSSYTQKQSPKASNLLAQSDFRPNQHPLPRPAETPSDELVSTPLSNSKSRDARRVTPAEDPDVRRDFEARIAAATAALNRTPSVGSGLTRKNTKKGALIISSPTLVSTSVRLSGAPVTTPVNSDVAKALEKASGSGSKISARWRKLGFRRGLSVSNSPDISSLATTAKSNKLADPISLRALSPTHPTPVSAPMNMTPSTTAAHVQSPDLDAFRFPKAEHPVTRSQSTTANVSSPGLQQVMGKTRRGRSEDEPIEPVPEAEAMASKPTAPPELTLHSPSSSTDSAVIKFIAAGRAVGLDDGQLNDMLVAKGMLNRSASSASSTAPTSTAPTGSAVQTPRQSPASTSMSRLPSTGASAEKKSGGAKSLLRSLSRKKSKAALPEENAPDPVPTSEPPLPRSDIVRRTILLPQEFSLVPPSDQRSPAASPGKASPGQRKLSIKRKPIQLSHEDHALVQQSPRSFTSKASISSVQSGNSAAAHAHLAGADLLQPSRWQSSASVAGASDHDSLRRSSTGGSFYDLYGGDEQFSETLTSPVEEDQEFRLEAGNPATQAVEITEYADGKVVWSLVDALRHPDEIDSDAIRFDTPGNLNTRPHSESTSYSSRPDSKRESVGDVFANDKGLTGLVSNTAGLKFRHRSPADTAARPPTNIYYYTSSGDIGALIDHLSSDLNASRGRIDILPLERSEPPRGSPGSAGQFEDAPSPYKQPLPRPVHAGYDSIPRRQLFPTHPDNTAVSGRNASSSVYSGNGSPSAFSFASSGSGMPGEPPKSVEDRLQALLDRLKQNGVKA